MVHYGSLLIRQIGLIQLRWIAYSLATIALLCAYSASVTAQTYKRSKAGITGAAQKKALARRQVISIVVSPDGDDDGAGTYQDPIRSIPEAQARVQEFLATGPGPDVEVMLQPGEYIQDASLYFGPADCHPTRQVSWLAPLNKEVVVTGGVKLLGWTPLQRGIWFTKADMAPFRQLYVDGQRRVMAQQQLRPALKEVTLPGGHMAYKSDWLPPLSGNETSGLQLVYESAAATAILPLLNVVGDSTGQLLIPDTTLSKVICATTDNGSVPAFGSPAALVGSLALLDQPGEWYHDAKNGKVYYWPMPSEDLTTASVTAPLLDTLLLLDGRADAPVQNLKFKGITFSTATWTLNYAASGGDYWLPFSTKEHIPQPFAHVQLSHTQQVSFVGCRFTRLGGSAIQLNEGVKNTLLEYCLFEDGSANGVQLNPSLVATNTSIATIRNCLFRRLGVELTGSVGLLVPHPAVAPVQVSLSEFTQLPGPAIWTGKQSLSTLAAAQSQTSTVGRLPFTVEYSHISGCLLKHEYGGAITINGNHGGAMIKHNLLYRQSYKPDVMLGASASQVSFEANRTPTDTPGKSTVKLAGPMGILDTRLTNAEHSATSPANSFLIGNHIEIKEQDTP